MAAIRNLTVQLGIVSFNVALVKADEERKATHLNRVHRHVVQKLDANNQPFDVVELHPCGQEITCKTCVRSLKSDEVSSAFNNGGTFIEMSKSETESFKIPNDGKIGITEVVDMQELLSRPLLLTGNSYYLNPPAKEKFDPVSYALIRQAIVADGGVAIADVVLYNHEHRAAIMPTPGGLVMHLLRNADEVREQDSFKLPQVNDKQLELAKMVLASFRAKELRVNKTDAYEARLKTRVQEKIDGTQPTVTAAPAPPQYSALEQQLAAMIQKIKAEQPEEVVPEPKKTKKSKKGVAA